MKRYMSPDTGYARARAAGLRLRRLEGRIYQLHNGAQVLGIVDTSPRGYSAHIAPFALVADAPAIARNGPHGWAYMGRTATLTGAVALVLRGCGR